MPAGLSFWGHAMAIARRQAPGLFFVGPCRSGGGNHSFVRVAIYYGQPAPRW
jgi:hypothetical protein